MDVPPLRDPDFTGDVDLDAHLALLPEDARVKGLFFQGALERLQQARSDADPFARAGVPRQVYRAFHDYSYSDYLRLMVAIAELQYPNLPRGKGLREIGRSAYGILADSHIGRVIFGALGNDFGRIAAVGTKGWKLALNFGTVTFQSTGPNSGLYVLRDMPTFIETLQVGVVEGAVAAVGAQGRVRVHLRDLANGEIEVTWF